MSQASAKLRSARVSSQKARLVANQIRGKHIEEALGILTFAPQKSAHIIKKVLESAIANAEHNQGLDIDSLFVSTIAVDESFTMKRVRTRARGRALALTLFIVKLSSTAIVETNKESISKPWLCSALAMADSRTFLMMWADF